MLYQLKKGEMKPVETIDPEDAGSVVSVLSLEEAPGVLSKYISAGTLTRIFENTSMRYESYEDFDLLCVPFFHFSHQLKNSPYVTIFLQKNNLCFVCEKTGNVERLIEDFIKTNQNDITIGKLICAFFEFILKDDLSELDGIELRISGLEDRVLTDKQENFTKEIIGQRKRLMGIMNYYEQLLDILEYVGMNQKHALGSRSVHYITILHGKTDRLYDKVKGLREYVSEIREAYQAEVDIRMNNIMKILTIVTMIFMPLTLIVGWYGMNLRMPEYNSLIAYPLVILFSVFVAVFCIVFFKKQKWF